MTDNQGRRSGLFVVPGNRLGVIEEFLPGKGTYVEDGAIFSMTTGILLMDLVNKTVTISPKVHLPPFPRIGDTVLGQVTNIQSTSLTLRIFKVDGRKISGFLSGLLHASNVSREYVKTLFEYFDLNDVIRAKVISTVNNVFHLSTDEKKLGIISSRCSNCGHVLVPIKGKLGCPSCKKREKRKIAADYGLNDSKNS